MRSAAVTIDRVLLWSIDRFGRSLAEMTGLHEGVQNSRRRAVPARAGPGYRDIERYVTARLR